MAVAGATALAAGKMTKPQVLSVLNFGALLVHQYEEMQDPGWFPGQFNGGIFKSDSPRNYPMNANTAVCVNTALAYPFYIAPVLAPKKKWLGLAPVLFGMGQAVGHGIVFPRIAGDRYSPGFLAAALLHVPLGIAYIKALQEEGPIARADWVKALVYQATCSVLGVAVPNLLMRDKNSPYAFRKSQMGRHDRMES